MTLTTCNFCILQFCITSCRPNVFIPFSLCNTHLSMSSSHVALDQESNKKAQISTITTY